MGICDDVNLRVPVITVGNILSNAFFVLGQGALPMWVLTHICTIYCPCIHVIQQLSETDPTDPCLI